MSVTNEGPGAGLCVRRVALNGFCPSAVGIGLALALLVSGCAGGGAYVPPDAGASNQASSPPPPPPPSSDDPARAAGNPGGTIAPDAEIYSTTDRLFITDFRIDFAKTRNVLALVGVFPDRWEQLANIPFERIRELQFRGGMDTETFEKVRKGREDIQLNQNEIFRVTVNETDGSSYEFYAIIPRVRGFKDGQVWNLSMGGNGGGFDRIVFRPKQ